MTQLFAGDCCVPVLTQPSADGEAAVRDRLGSLAPYVHSVAADSAEIHLMVEGMSCGGCISTIERTLMAIGGVSAARVNLSSSRLRVVFDPGAVTPEHLIAALDAQGYRAVPYDPVALHAGRDLEERRLLRAMAVAGFAAANVMLLSVSVWAGNVQDMGPATRTLLHWISALVAVPAVFYAGRPFFDSALAAIRSGRTNMDVPISLAVILATGMSLLQTLSRAEHAYFDSAISLLFFLLIGRYLDRRARGKARSAAEQLAGLNAVAVTVVSSDGCLHACAPASVEAGMTVLVPAGERIPVDGVVAQGRSEIDTQLITGETLPEAVSEGDTVFAGAVNLAAPLKLTVTAAGEGTLLAEITRLMDAAEQRRARYVGLADAVSRWYAPIVHAMALAAFCGWFLLAGAGWQDSLMIAIAVLIVTCPCALGLAVPVVQVIACARLMRGGVLLKNGSALERLARVDTIVFDKTGTLTLGRPELRDVAAIDIETLRAAASIAATSSHPLAKALVAAAGEKIVAVDNVTEAPGAGLIWQGGDGEHRLGSRVFLGGPESAAGEPDTGGPEIWYGRPGRNPVRFQFDDAPRPDAAWVVGALKKAGLDVRLLSGDREPVVAAMAGRLGIEEWTGRVTPNDKLRYMEDLRAAGRHPAMVGDGLNDAPALAAALVSLSPSSGADISRNAADIVFQSNRLGGVWESYLVAIQSEALVRQNFAMAFLYNLITVPLAVCGFVTPLIAAVAMSSSSLVVILNALRLGWTGSGRSDRVPSVKSGIATTDGETGKGIK